MVPTQYLAAPSAGRHPSPVSILLVEDNPSDVRLLQEALKDLRLAHSLDVVSDGQEALDFLFRHGKYETARRPDLVLLDLNLPGKGGSEILAIVKERVETRRIPVVVFTSSSAQVDIKKRTIFTPTATSPSRLSLRNSAWPSTISVLSGLRPPSFRLTPIPIAPVPSLPSLCSRRRSRVNKIT